MHLAYNILMTTEPPNPDRPEEADGLAAQRGRMVEHQLRRRGIRDERVLAAMGRVPRERFMVAGTEPMAYEDKAIAIDHNQTISQPYMVALMTQLLELAPESRVLEIGMGSGYQAAVLAELCQHVYTIDRIPELVDSAMRTLAGLGYGNVSATVGDGTLGWPGEAPFDGILVTAGAPSVPNALTDQLAEGGRLVIPVGRESYTTLTAIERRGRTLVEKPSIACRFVPLIGEAGWDSAEQANRHYNG